MLLSACSFLWPTPLPAQEALIPVIDLHVDLAYQSLFKGRSFSHGLGQFSAAELLPAGVRGVVLPLFVPRDARPRGRTRRQLERSYAHVFRAILQTRPYSLPGCQVGRAGGESRAVSTWLSFEGAGPVGGDEEEIQKWALRGVRSFGLVHSENNRLATSSGRSRWSKKSKTGLSKEGRKFVKAVVKSGGVVDVSHASDAAADEAIALSLSLGAPIMATHSNARALAPHPRNLTDEQIEGIAKSGGIVGVNFHQPFLAASPGGTARLSDVVRQIKYLSKLGGIDVVAIGSDFEGGISAVPELSDVTRFQRLAQALLDAGFERAQVRQIFSENALRVLCANKSSD